MNKHRHIHNGRGWAFSGRPLDWETTIELSKFWISERIEFRISEMIYFEFLRGCNFEFPRGCNFEFPRGCNVEFLRWFNFKFWRWFNFKYLSGCNFEFLRWSNFEFLRKPNNKIASQIPSPDTKQNASKKITQVMLLVKSQCLNVLHFYCSPCWAVNSKQFSSVKRFSFTLRLLNLELNFFANVLVFSTYLVVAVVALVFFSHVLFCEFICVYGVLWEISSRCEWMDFEQ